MMPPLISELLGGNKCLTKKLFLKITLLSLRTKTFILNINGLGDIKYLTTPPSQLHQLVIRRKGLLSSCILTMALT
jgi:hypothetical protein